MLRNYFKIAIRQFAKNKGFALINIMGLAIGIAVSIIGFLYVLNELSYDQFHKKADRIYRIAAEGITGATELYQVETSPAYAQSMYNDFPEIEKIARVARWDFQFRFKENFFVEKDVFVTDSSFFDVFSIIVLKGQKENLLTEPYTAVINESTALKYFGSTNPINKIIKEDSTAYKVVAVVKDLPQNSHFHFNVAISFVSYDGYYNSQNWGSNWVANYILLKKNIHYEQVEQRFPEFVNKYIYGGNYDQSIARGNKWELFLQPLTSIHLNSNLRGEFKPNGKREYVYIFLIISIFILVIACINFINLSTANAEKRAKEVGIKKVVGSSKYKLVKQFLGESITISFLALFIALSIVEISLIYLPNLLNIDLEIPYFTNYYTIPILLLSGLIVGILAGTYPAFALASFKPIYVLKGGGRKRKGNSVLRNILVVFQFSISIVLIIGTFIISSQLNLLQNQNIGFDKNQVIVLKNVNAINKSVSVLKNEIEQLSFVDNVSLSSNIPGLDMINWGCRIIGGNYITLNIFYADEDFNKVLKLGMDEGRYFSNLFRTDSSAIVLNEEARKLVLTEETIGTKIWFSEDKLFHVVGVVNNFNYESKHQKVHPMAILSIYHPKSRVKYASIRVKSGDYKQMINQLNEVWDNYISDVPFNYEFLDQQYDSLYDKETQTKRLFIGFSVLAIVIACLGLLGLASFMAQQKIKEIGVRKTFGASVWSIVLLLSKSFSKWVIIANIMAWPIAWFFFDRWLNNFEERCNISWKYFVLSAIISFLIAWLTVSFQTFKSAIANPIKALRYE